MRLELLHNFSMRFLLLFEKSLLEIDFNAFFLYYRRVLLHLISRRNWAFRSLTRIWTCFSFVFAPIKFFHSQFHGVCSIIFGVFFKSGRNVYLRSIMLVRLLFFCYLFYSFLFETLIAPLPLLDSRLSIIVISRALSDLSKRLSNWYFSFIQRLLNERINKCSVFCFRCLLSLFC